MVYLPLSLLGMDGDGLKNELQYLIKMRRKCITGGKHMAKREIRLSTDEILRKKCKVVKEIDERTDAAGRYG